MLFAGDGEMFMSSVLTALSAANECRQHLTQSPSCFSNFAEDLGEDFFGFRELGLDKELGLASFSVPSRLFHGSSEKGLPGPLRTYVQPAILLLGHSQRRLTQLSDPCRRPEPVLEHPPPPDFVRFALSDVPLQIGLLRPFYEAEFRKLLPAPLSSSGVPMPSTAATTTALPTPANSTAASEPVMDITMADASLALSPAGSARILPTPLPTEGPSPPPATAQPTLSSLPQSTTLPEDHFDPVLLKKLGTLSQIPMASSASVAAAKRKKEAHAAAAAEIRGRREHAPPKKKSKATGVGCVPSAIHCYRLSSSR